MRVVWSYHEKEPSGGAVGPGSLPAHEKLYRGSQSLYLVQRVDQEIPRPEETAKVWELRNKHVQLPSPGETLYWCRVFKMPEVRSKQHLIRVSIYHYCLQLFAENLVIPGCKVVKQLTGGRA